MLARLMLGTLLFAAGLVFGWQLRGDLAEKDCEAAGGAWVYPGVCQGADRGPTTG